MSDIDRILVMPELQKLVPLSRSQIWRLERTGDFPKRVLLGQRRVGWRASEIGAWIAGRVGHNRAPDTPAREQL